MVVWSGSGLMRPTFNKAAGLVTSQAPLPSLARSVSAGTHGYFRSWGQTGCAIRLSATAALDPQQTLAANLCRNSRRSEAFIREHGGSVPRSLRTAPRRNRPGEIDGDRPGQRHAAQLTRRYQPRADDLAVVEL